MGISSSFEIFFSLPGQASPLRRPLYFHHVPKTAGTSFRASVRDVIRDGLSLIRLPGVREVLQSGDGTWPEGLREFCRTVLPRVDHQIVMSHYTALLEDQLPGEVVAIVREPTSQLLSVAGFFSRRVIGIADRRPDRILAATKINNVQTRSFTDEEIPAFAPASPKKMAYWVGVVDRIVDRFTLFRLSDYERLLEYVADEHGLILQETRKKTASNAASVKEAQGVVERAIEASGRDPVWLDRILYERVRAR